ncbi:MAG TPA: TIGR03086 family metal-binding protein [Dermatophilaceae bacterium]|jgi:uncharacterized protein (TIGR03086 family)|nr:TIGR03086 family metal-binding protein [Dermatophilaceae bacterium]
MDLPTLYQRTLDWWVTRVDTVGEGQWSDPTPCTKWSVRDLVNHVVAEDRWTAPLLEGATIAEAGHRFDGDPLGDDPVASAHEAAEEAGSSAAALLPTGGRVHLSYGEEDMEEYARQLCADHLIHGWDLAAAVGADRRMDPELVDEVAAWFADREEMYRAGGAVAVRPDDAGDPQTDLLAAFGRSAAWTTPGGGTGSGRHRTREGGRAGRALEGEGAG